MGLRVGSTSLRLSRLNNIRILGQSFYLSLKTSVNSVKNARRLTLPDRDSTNVIRRLLKEQGKLDFGRFKISL